MFRGLSLSNNIKHECPNWPVFWPVLFNSAMLYTQAELHTSPSPAFQKDAILFEISWPVIK